MNKIMTIYIFVLTSIPFNLFAAQYISISENNDNVLISFDDTKSSYMYDINNMAFRKIVMEASQTKSQYLNFYHNNLTFCIISLTNDSILIDRVNYYDNHTSPCAILDLKDIYSEPSQIKNYAIGKDEMYLTGCILVDSKLFIRIYPPPLKTCQFTVNGINVTILGSPKVANSTVDIEYWINCSHDRNGAIYSDGKYIYILQSKYRKDYGLIYNIDSDSWALMNSTMICLDGNEKPYNDKLTRSCFSHCMHDDSIYIYGGFDTTRSLNKPVLKKRLGGLVFSIRDNVWREIPEYSLQYAKGSRYTAPAMQANDGRILLMTSKGGVIISPQTFEVLGTLPGIGVNEESIKGNLFLHILKTKQIVCLLCYYDAGKENLIAYRLREDKLWEKMAIANE